MESVYFNPITKRKITYGGRVYNRLISEGYTDEQLQKNNIAKPIDTPTGLGTYSADEILAYNHARSRTSYTYYTDLNNKDNDILKEQKIINIVVNVILEAFHKAKLGHACLAASLILSDLLKKHSINHKLIFGFGIIDFAGEKCGLRHVWVKHNKIAIDIGTKLMKKFNINNPLFENIKLSNEIDESVILAGVDEDFEDIIQCDMECYWDKAPEYLKEIRKQLCK